MNEIGANQQRQQFDAKQNNSDKSTHQNKTSEEKQLFVANNEPGAIESSATLASAADSVESSATLASAASSNTVGLTSAPSTSSSSGGSSSFSSYA